MQGTRVSKKSIKTTSHVESEGNPLKTVLSTPSPACLVKSSSRSYTQTNGQIQPVLLPILPGNRDTHQPEAPDEKIALSQESLKDVSKEKEEALCSVDVTDDEDGIFD
ncbi:hypothetical protein K435DRAFT_854808 [Dendrothele bispora CBS 962.96]|uniref:Uncharacterized protein n=1 Tax=Dendrothele bispora (strain CBS 962.96) TaxID=1314807 RepID=A0A4S8MCS1_DENBC|nr:hypothetical protein K435DRAFT_854808 [Dendrothele bispora CBS 962.96]